MSDKIRNIQQSVQHRNVIKQASDITVYIDGADYLINPYLGAEGVPVSFNDFVNSWQSSYDIDTTVPSGSLTLVVPVQFDPLFRSPGGNHILNTMAEIRVYAKGYYPSAKGNTLYHQIFKGYISSISYASDGTMVNISIACFGALGMLERMQIEQNPSGMSSSPLAMMPFTSTAHNLDPYKMLAYIFLYSSMIDGFEQASVQQMALEHQYTDQTGHRAGNPYYEAVEERYVAKWQALLYDLARDTHIFGNPNVTDVIAAIRDAVKKPDGHLTPFNKDAMGIFSDYVGKEKESDQIAAQTPFNEQLRSYMPDMGFSSMQLLNGRVTTRLERLRFITSHIGFEAYQDIDGAIVIKPPLYNLDVVNLVNDGSVPNVPADPPADPSLDGITVTTNPFIVQQDEIINEQETEDEAGVRLTRLTARGSQNPSFQFDGNKEFLTVAEDIDIAKLSQFGSRTEPPREANWIRDGDPAALYAYVASELARANRGFRYYSITIPMRPEIKLGFPMYFPHKDIYGYIKSVTMNWTRGSNATTTVVLDSLRRRPLFPNKQTVPFQDGPGNQQVQLMTQQENLVLQWTQAPTGQTDTGSGNAQLDGKIASLPIPQQLIVKQTLQMQASRTVSGREYGINTDSTTHNWRVQVDKDNLFSKPRTLGSTYYNDLRTHRPYTDEKGYELVGPFPWGRWKSLKDSLTTFTIANSLYASLTSSNPVVKPVSAETSTLSGAAAFLFTGDSVAASSESTTDLLSGLVSQRSSINNYKVFELDYSGGAASSTGLGSNLSANTSQGQTNPAATNSTLFPSPVIANPTAQSVIDARTATMLSGTATSTDLFKSILDQVRTQDDENLPLES